MEKLPEKDNEVVTVTNTVIKDQIESIREKIAEISLPIVKNELENFNQILNTEKSKASPEKFEFPEDLDPSEVKVTKVFWCVISQDFCWTEPSGIYY